MAGHKYLTTQMIAQCDGIWFSILQLVFFKEEITAVSPDLCFTHRSERYVSVHMSYPRDLFTRFRLSDFSKVLQLFVWFVCFL